jgi:hypothetical protein
MTETAEHQAAQAAAARDTALGERGTAAAELNRELTPPSPFVADYSIGILRFIGPLESVSSWVRRAVIWRTHARGMAMDVLLAAVIRVDIQLGCGV